MTKTQEDNKKNKQPNECEQNDITFNYIICAKPFVALPTDRRTKYLQNRCSFMRRICTKKMGAISQLGAEKITFPPKRG